MSERPNIDVSGCGCGCGCGSVVMFVVIYLCVLSCIEVYERIEMRKINCEQCETCNPAKKGE